MLSHTTNFLGAQNLGGMRVSPLRPRPIPLPIPWR